MQRKGWAVLGHLCVALGVIGLLLPVMPTVVFLIAAAACYARGNPALKQRLLAHPRLGPPVRDWEEHRAISRRGKLLGLAMLSVGIGVSVVWLLDAAWLRVMLLGTGVVLAGFLLSLDTSR